MPQYFSPGVYVEEIDPGPRPIVGVSTSVAGAIGVTAKGPTSGKPVLVTSFADFVAKFGGYLTEPADPAIVNDWAGSATEGGRWWQFANSVEGFFLNGGQQLYVKRVFSSTATASAANLGGGLVIPLAADAKRGDTTVELEHLLGLDDGGGAAGTAFDLVRGDTQAVVGSFEVEGYDPVRNRVTLAGGETVPEDLEAGRDFAEIQQRTAAPVADADATLVVRANALGAWGNDLSVRVEPMVGASLGILPDPGEGGAVFSRVAAPAVAGDSVVAWPRSPALDANTPNFTARIGDLVMAVDAGAGPAAGQVSLTVPALPADVPVGTTVQRLRIANRLAPTPPRPTQRQQDLRVERRPPVPGRHRRARQRQPEGPHLGRGGRRGAGHPERRPRARLPRGRPAAAGRGEGAGPPRPGRAAAGRRGVHQPAPGARRQPEHAGRARQRPLRLRRPGRRRRLRGVRPHRLPDRRQRRLADPGGRRRPARGPVGRRLRRRRRRQRQPHRHRGPGGHRRDRICAGPGHLVAHRAVGPDRPLRAAEGPLRHPRPAATGSASRRSWPSGR